MKPNKRSVLDKIPQDEDSLEVKVINSNFYYRAHEVDSLLKKLYTEIKQLKGKG